MLIILESADCTGKSTLANYLLNVYSLKLIITPRKPGPVQDFKQANSFDTFLLERAKDKDRTYVLDRHTPSNYAYGKMRGESPAQLAKYLVQWRNFVEQAGNNLCTIWLTRQPKQIDDDLISLTKEQDAIVLNAYKQLAMMSNEPSFNIIQGKHTYSDILIYTWQKLLSQ